jgi:hypothetical protein
VKTEKLTENPRLLFQLYLNEQTPPHQEKERGTKHKF